MQTEAAIPSLPATGLWKPDGHAACASGARRRRRLGTAAWRVRSQRLDEGHNWDRSGGKNRARRVLRTPPDAEARPRGPKPRLFRNIPTASAPLTSPFTLARGTSKGAARAGERRTLRSALAHGPRRRGGPAPPLCGPSGMWIVLRLTPESATRQAPKEPGRRVAPYTFWRGERRRFSSRALVSTYYPPQCASLDQPPVLPTGFSGHLGSCPPPLAPIAASLAYCPPSGWKWCGRAVGVFKSPSQPAASTPSGWWRPGLHDILMPANTWRGLCV
jgi:hypothetical protein